MRAASSGGTRRLSAIAAGIALAGVLVAWQASAGAEPKRAGDATLVTGGGSAKSRTDGGSETDFSLRLPAGASCPGDSADDGYRVQSFIVPVADDPGALRYKSTGPEGDGRYALYDVFTRSYAQAQTANADNPGAPGLIVNIPSFNFAVFPAGTLGDGRYHVGIACTLAAETVRYWATDLVLTRAIDDKPGGFRWRAAGPPATSSKTAALGAVALSAVALASIGVSAGVVVGRRRAGTRRVRSEAP